MLVSSDVSDLEIWPLLIGSCFSKSDAAYASLEWSAIQTLFEKAHFDVLLLLDCCAAAASASPTIGSSVIETIAACGFESIAPPPGRFSFSNSLAEVLEDWRCGPPFSAAMLHNKVLSVLKHERPEWPPGEKRRRVEYRRTPIHFVASIDPRLPSIELGRRSVPVPQIVTPEGTKVSKDGDTSSHHSRLPKIDIDSNEGMPSLKRKGYHPDDLSEKAGENFDVTRVVISLALEEDQSLNSESCQKWLASCPALIKIAKVEAVWKSFSTLVLLSIPVFIWDMLPQNPACSFVGYITSPNLLDISDCVLQTLDAVSSQKLTSHPIYPPSKGIKREAKEYHTSDIKNTDIMSTRQDSGYHSLTPSAASSTMATTRNYSENNQTKSWHDNVHLYNILQSDMSIYGIVNDYASLSADTTSLNSRSDFDRALVQQNHGNLQFPANFTYPPSIHSELQCGSASNYYFLGTELQAEKGVVEVGMGSKDSKIGISKKPTYIRPKHERVHCSRCTHHPDGFRGEHELRRHTDREHTTIVKKWVCVVPNDGQPHPEPNIPLSSCKSCNEQKKKYGAYYNACAHLRRVHFHPKPKGRSKTKAMSYKVKDLEEGGRGRGDWPSGDELKCWIWEVEERVTSSELDFAGTQQEPELSEDEMMPLVSNHGNVSSTIHAPASFSGTLLNSSLPDPNVQYTLLLLRFPSFTPLHVLYERARQLSLA